MVKKGSGREVKVKLCESGRQEKINAARAALFPIALFNDNELSFGTLFAVKPVCGADQKMVYGVAHGEIASINCTVKANPTTGIRFRWTFNSSAELNTLPQSRYTVMGPTSQVG